MAQFVKRQAPIIHEAVQLNEAAEVDTPEGTVIAKPLDWVVTDTAGEQHVYSPEVFHTLYDPA